jgi:CubicO group peptidase (beta-lactamase class C family)
MRAPMAGALRVAALLLALCAPLRAGATEALVALPPQPDEVSFPTTEWPEGPPEAGVERLLDEAFAEPDPDRPRRTRAVVVVRGGRIVAERYAPGFPRETRLQGWSVTKSIVNALVALRVRDGKLDLRAPADVPAWRGAGDPRGAITPDVLLRASSGLGWSETYEDGPLRSSVIAMLYRDGRRDMARFAAERTLAHPVDTHFSYSSGTTLILCGVLRRGFGGDDAAYRAFPRRALFEPLGMRSALLETDASGTFVGSSYSWATARDWARFGLLYLRDGVWDGARLLPAGWVDYTRTPTPTSPRGEYGAHFWLNAGWPERGVAPPEPRAPRDLFYASGHDGQVVAIVPSRDLVVVRLGLTPSDGRYDLDGFVAAVANAFPPLGTAD